MDNFVEDPIGNSENPDQPEYKVFDRIIDKEPLDVYTVAYHLLKYNFDYPIQIEESTTDKYGHKNSNGLRIMVDSLETEKKIQALLHFLCYEHSLRFNLLSSTGFGSPWNIIKLLQGDLQGYLKNISGDLVQSYEKKPDRIYTIKEDLSPLLPIAERCFMSSVEIRYKRDPYGGPPEYKKIYDELEEKGVRPLTPEVAGGLLALVIEEILDKHPDLRPNPPSESDIDDTVT